MAATGAGAAAPVAGLLGFALALQLVLGAYDGWAGGVYFAGEDRAPERNLPRAILGGVLLVAAVYLAMNLALLHVLPFERLAASPLPAADAARAWLGERGAQLVTAIAALSMLPLLSGVLLVASRIAHAMASDGLLPRPLATVDRRGAPVPALVGCAGVGIALIAVSGGALNVVIGAGALLAILSYIGGFLALLVLRRREPQLQRPFRAWGAPYSTCAVLAVSVALALGAVPGAPRESLIALGLLAASYPVYRLRHRAATTATDAA
jgi:APA family basic amino acid/polyamine antiporter